MIYRSLLLIPILASGISPLSAQGGQPTIDSFTPASGQEGTLVNLKGSHLLNVQRITFGGVLAQFHWQDDTTIVVPVPTGAMTGPITVTTDRGCAVSSSTFIVTPASAAPYLTAFEPMQGPVGALITIMGAGFRPGAGVSFNGVHATNVTFVNSALLRAVVPAGATTGPLSVSTSQGTATSTVLFTVETGSSAPTVGSFSPVQGAPGTLVTIQGTGFLPEATVTFGGVGASQVTWVSATQLKATVPANAVTGPVAVTTPGGTGRSAGIFTVASAPTGPSIAFFAPTQGLAGTLVTLTGTGFTSGAAVAFNGTPSTGVTFVSASQLRATVPAGATTGPITVTVPGGTATSTGSFTVPGVAPTGNLAFGGWYLTQSVQTLSRSMPLVAGRDALLRVFPVTNGASQAGPPVRVTITGGTPSPWVQTIAPPGSITTSVSEGSLGASWNLAVPGAVLAPGATLKLELDPGATVPDSDRSDNILQAPLDVRPVKIFRVTVIPVTQQGLTGNVTQNGRTLVSWADKLQRMYPIMNLPGGVEVLQGAPYTTQANLNTGSDGWSQLLNEIETKRRAEASDRHYFGSVNLNYSGGIAGLGFIGAPSAIGWDKSGYGDGSNYPDVLAHEVGHNFGRWHAPCGNVSGVDPNWPTDAAHTNAQVGVYGYDLRTGTLEVPTLFDLMSYCHPSWVSDYNYKGVMDFRASNSIGLRSEGFVAPVECLLVSGVERQGVMQLASGYSVTTLPSPPEGSEFVLELRDADGCNLKRVHFAPYGIADLPCGSERQFAFAVPLDPVVKRALRTLRVVAADGRIMAARVGGLAGPAEPPTAVRAQDGKVHVEWNALNNPEAMVRDSRSGEVLSFAKGGAVDLETTASSLEVSLSNGLISTLYVVDVKP